MPDQQEEVALDSSPRSELRRSPIMAHLLDALERGVDIEHYGRLVFAMVARYFLNEEDILDLLARQPGEDHTSAENLLLQVKQHEYSPPRRETILKWQSQQEFPICPTPDDPASCNLFEDLQFPDNVYEHLADFWEEQLD